jgi:hypothetical protein
MANPDDVSQQPLARAVLAKLAETRRQDALGSLARTVLGGQASLRSAAAHPWHGQALAPAFDEALEAQRRLSPQQRDDIERKARRLSGGNLHQDPADNRDDTRYGTR